MSVRYFEVMMRQSISVMPDGVAIRDIPVGLADANSVVWAISAAGRELFVCHTREDSSATGFSLWLGREGSAVCPSTVVCPADLHLGDAASAVKAVLRWIFEALDHPHCDPYRSAA